jgi:multidrug efflux pump subunit AcrA (membrane-fusion protein)
LIPARASFAKDGKPAVFQQVGKAFVTRPIQLGRQNDEDVIVTSGLKEGDVVTLENPAESAKRAKKKL